MINNNSEKKEFKRKNNKKKVSKKYASLKKDGIIKFLEDRKIRNKEIDNGIAFKYEKDLVENKGFHELKKIEDVKGTPYINEESLRLKIVEHHKKVVSEGNKDSLKINIITYFFRNEREMNEFIKETSKEN